jgi:hypothetical protein
MTDRLISPADCRTHIIQPALWAIGLWSQLAEELLLGIALQETGLRTRRQRGGPALGFWQMEPATHDDIWKNYLRYPSRGALAARVRNLCAAEPAAALLESNDRYACAMARLDLLRAPEPLPPRGDIAGYAAYWKRFYNTAGGAGTAAEFIANWKAAQMPDPAAVPPPVVAAAAPKRVLAIMNPLGIVTDAEARAFRDALDIQINRHVAPAWGLAPADIVLVEDKTLNLSNCAPDFEPLVLLDQSDQQGALGYHYDLTAAGKPAGKIFVGTDRRYGDPWTATGSHEGIEQYVDPLCNAIAIVNFNGRSVFTLREACDAVEAQTYDINGVVMSNFQLPAFFDTVTPHPPGTKFDYLGRLTAPMQIADGGYLSIRDPTAGTGWGQVFGEQVPLHKMTPPHGSRRDRFLAGHHRLRRAPAS